MTEIKEPYNLVIAGVGGQGNILASSIVSMAANSAGYTVVVGETYGASQRGGSVMSHIRFSQNKEFGPLVPYGQADCIVAFEPLEALRVASKYAHPNTGIILNTEPVFPVSVIFHEVEYPKIEDILIALKSLAGAVFTLDATTMAREVGEPWVQNIIMINALFMYSELPVKRMHFNLAMQEFLKTAGTEKKEINKRAFELPVKLYEVR